MARELAVVLANGSVQSAVACAIAAQKYRIVMVMAETAPSMGRAGQAFDALVQHFKPYRSHRLPMPFLQNAKNETRGGSAANPRSSEESIGVIVDLMPIVAMGLRFAIQYSAVGLHMGTRVGGSGDGETDRRGGGGVAIAAEIARHTEFGQLWAEMAQVTCERPALDVSMPLLELEPWQVVDLGLQVATPMNLTWSCEQLNGEACGSCRGCRDRELAFQRAGRPDPAKVPQKA